MTVTPQQLIKQFSLQPHPEGGYYKETYRSAEVIPVKVLDKRFKGDRNFSTAIYFLLEQGNFSAFHKIQSDECWHFYAGGLLLIHVIHINGKFETIKLGSDLQKGEVFQYVIPAGCWFASEPAPGTEFSFVGCTVAPGFDFDDFTLAKADVLAKTFPKQETIIRRLCRQ
ncbi:cupin domain-containing protein [Ferruginibacter albus]|uniref:cupin domain-containing protein n=1 Tax=Ferruginibacter albus TaxID=2875540 RepID=UPI001CC5D10B|nr:cupin domain-containing protein [Ferruginibacter albus]UAY52309.1 cupin domain-containing protein [Ferruginibacter albus]